MTILKVFLLQILFFLIYGLKPDQQCRNVVIFIPARGGSKGIKLKNLAKIGNDTLLARTIDIIKKSKSFRDIWVSTDHPKIAEEAENNDAIVHWRQPYTATDAASTLLAAQEFLHYHPGIQYLAIIQVTSPFLCPNDLQKGVREFNNDCVFSVTRSHSLRWSIDNYGFATPTNFYTEDRPRRQDWPGDLLENGMFYFTTSSLIRKGLLQNNRCKIIEIDKTRSLEIDTPFDLHISKLLSKKFSCQKL